MKALQFQAIQQVALIDADPPSIGDDELLIKTGAAVICTSDLNDLRENAFGIQLPVIMGHEGAGTVVAVGPQVNDFGVGDRVTTHPVHPCGQCVNCRNDMGHLCLDMGHFALNRPGVFAEYFAVRADRARHIPDTMPFTVAALAEPVSVCLEALNQANLPPGGTLLIIGDGPFGVLIARLAQALPLDKVVIAGRHDFRLGFATGAVQINEKKVDDPMARLRAESEDGAKQSGYDAVIQAVGTGQAVRQGLALLRPKGRLVVFSAVPGETPIDLFDLHVRELEIVGACNDQDLLDAAVASLSDPALGLGELVTHQLPLEAYQQALDLAATGREEAMKVAFVFDEEAV
jgi:threonine dehydrogenase-like Zn-dependent dehydrogenase